MTARVTCWRFDAAADAAARQIERARRPEYLTEHGWTRTSAGDWTHPTARAVFTTAAAVRTQLREDRTR